MSQLLHGELPGGLDAVAVIMAGGSGTRFWPLSRKSMPKQFLSFWEGEESLIQETAGRLMPLIDARGVLVVTAQNQKDLVRAQLPEACVLIEPCPRNTAACIGFAAKYVLRSVGDVPMLCLPSDHIIANVSRMQEVFEKAICVARDSDALVTIGIEPTTPETGYGYIRRGDEVGNNSQTAYRVKQFVEKPDKDTAQAYLKSGEFFWNSGMFVWRPSVLLRAIEKHVPDLAVQLDAIDACFSEPTEASKENEVYQAMPAVSIDVGVLEKANNVSMLVGDCFEWNDVGSWSSWAEHAAQKGTDRDGNVVGHNAFLLGSTNCAVVGSKRVVAGVGLDDLIIVDTDDAVLVCNRNNAQDVKKLTEVLKKKGRSELL